MPESQRPQAWNFNKKETLTQVFSFEFCEIFKNTFFTEHLQTTASKISLGPPQISASEKKPSYNLGRLPNALLH